MRFLLLIYIIIPFQLLSQDTKDVSVSIDTTKTPEWDTNYYKKYSERFIFSIYQSQRHFEVEFDPKSTLDSGKASHHYFADANTISGIEIDFDKISLSFSTKSTPPAYSNLKGKTSYTNFGLSFGGNKWFVESAYRRYKGFYDKKTAVYDTSYKAGSPYYQNSSMANESVKIKFFYFKNSEDFAYKSAYTCVYRQLKSAGSWVYSSNLYYNNLKTDSSFTAPLTRKYYGADGTLTNLRMLGLSGGGGFSFNIVLWKGLFFNLTGLANLESQWRKNTWLDGKTNNVQYITMSFDLRVAFGLNVKNFFVTLSSINDRNIYSSGQLNLTTKMYSGNFTLGYRFKVKPPTWYKKIQASKIYNKF